jgi:hypothetical protein
MLRSTFADKLTLKERYTIALALQCAIEAIDDLQRDPSLEWLYRSRSDMEELLKQTGLKLGFLLMWQAGRNLFGKAAQQRDNSKPKARSASRT